MSDLTEAIEQFQEAVKRSGQRKKMERLVRPLEMAMRRAFRAQGNKVVQNLRQAKRYFAEGEAGERNSQGAMPLSMSTLAPQQDTYYTSQQGAYHAPLREGLPPDEVNAIWAMVTLETTKLFSGPIEAAAAKALKLGGAAMIAEMGIGISFDLKNPRAVNYLRDYGAKLVTKINETTRETLQTLISQGAEEGWSYKRTAGEIISRFEEMAVGKPQEHIDSRAHLIAVTECLSGDTFIEAFPRTVFPLPHSIHFFSSGRCSIFPLLNIPLGRIIGYRRKSSILGATRRWYKGEMIDIVTSRGHKLSGTPNHPILTNRGWIALGSLIEGDNIICREWGEKMGFSNPNINYIPTKISEIFYSLQSSPTGITERICGSDMDFHGDGMEGKVEIVMTNRELSIKAKTSFLEPILHQSFPVSNLRFGEISSFRSINNGRLGFPTSLSEFSELTHPSDCTGMSIGERDKTFMGGSLRPHHFSGFGHISNMHPSLPEDRANTIIRDIQGFGDRFTSLPRGITFDYIVNVNRFHFSGHVYNLSTNNGCYIANGIITHNCGNAYEEGNRITAKDLQDAGIEQEKFWSTVGDDRVSDGCRENEDAGWIGIDQPFPSGHQNPGRFPGCRCIAIYRRMKEK